jgi:hypothetical protein
MTDIPGLKDGLIDTSVCRLLLVVRVANEKMFGSIAQHKESGQIFWVVRLNDSKWAGLLAEGKSVEDFTKDMEKGFYAAAAAKGKTIAIEYSYPPENIEGQEMIDWMLKLDLIHPPRPGLSTHQD